MELTHNRALLQAMRDTHAKIHLARARSAYDADRARSAYEEHCRVVEAILIGDGVQAAELLEAHLRSSLINALALLHEHPTSETA